MAQPHFRYLPLLRPDSIRLLHLKPAEASSSTICVEFSNVQLPLSRPKTRSFAKYKALSYTWGDPSNRQSISSSAGALLVTRNLFEALIHLRQPSKTMTLWVDAVCINQGDTRERDAQVKLMGQIYSLAELVVVWLGAQGDSSNLVPPLVDRLGALWDERDQDDTSIITQHELNRHGIPPRDAPVWSAFLALLRRPWATRVWVIQEVALSPGAVVMCGHVEMGWGDVAEAATMMERAQIFDPTQLAGTNGISIIDDTMAQCRDGARFQLDHLLGWTRRYQATDPRDKVFGLLGMVDDGDSAAIEIDYSVDTAALYLKVAWYLIESRNALYVLEHAGFSQHVAGLPSWVPDWSFRLREDFMKTADVSCGAYWLTCTEHSLSLVGDAGGRSLCVQGVKIDMVDEVSAAMDDDEGKPPTEYRNTERRFSRVFDEWENLAARIGRQNYPTDVNGDNLIDAYWKTIIAGTTAEMEEVDLDYGRYFVDWYKKFRPNGKLDISAVTLRDSDLTSYEGAMTFSGCVFDAGFMKRFGRTKRNYAGIFPREAKTGDSIAILFGCRFPVVLGESEAAWNFIGVCYIQGICLDDLVCTANKETDIIVFRIL